VSACPVSSARRNRREINIPTTHNTLRAIALLNRNHSPRLDTDIDIPALRNSHLDTTRRAQHRSAFKKHS